MNIVHVLSQNQLTGAEVYAATLISQQKKSGHTVFQISNQFFKKTDAIQKSLVVETKNIFQFAKSAKELRRFLIKNKIHVVHSHSRASAKLVFYARLGLKIGHVSTVHGRQHVSLSKKIMNQYGEFIIPVCKNIYDQLTQEFLYNPRRLQIVPNPIDSDQFKTETTQEVSDLLRIGIIGRLTGPKKIRTELFIQNFSQLLKDKNIKHEFTVIGGKFGSEVKSTEHVEINSQFLQQYDLICGSGRVAMEAIMSGVPCIAFGESSYVGLITETNFEKATESCFGDIGINFELPQFNEAQALNDLETFFQKKTRFDQLAELGKDFFNTQYISIKIMRLYESAYFLRNYSKWIPILMYHKIPDQDLNSPHKIFVTKHSFEKHLEFFKNFNLTSMTFNDLSLFRKGLKDWSEFPKNPIVLTFDDGYVDNITNADPLLKKYKAKAHIYLLADKKIESNVWDNATDENDRHEIISGEQRHRWNSTNFVIGSHGLSHKRLPRMKISDKLHELTESKKRLEDEFSKRVISFAYTYGDTNTDCAEAAQRAGYEYAVNTDSGGLIAEEAPYAIFRVNIFPDETFMSLWKKTRKWYRQYYYLKRGQ